MNALKFLSGWLLAAFMGLAVVLAACGAESAEGIEENNLRPVTTRLNDGREVECIVFQTINEGGLWCTLKKDGTE